MKYLASFSLTNMWINKKLTAKLDKKRKFLIQQIEAHKSLSSIAIEIDCHPDMISAYFKLHKIKDNERSSK